MPAVFPALMILLFLLLALGVTLGVTRLVQAEARITSTTDPAKG